MNINWLLFSFQGRLNRQPFWLFSLCAGLIWLVLSLLLGIDRENSVCCRWLYLSD